MGEKIVRVAEMSDELAVALGLALFCATEHRENFAQRFAWQQAAQENDRLDDALEIDVEIRACETEHDADVVFVEHDGIDGEAVFQMLQSEYEGRLATIRLQSADEVGACALEKHRPQQLDGAHLAPEARGRGVGTALLAEVGVRLTCADNGLEALRCLDERAAEQPFDLVLMDWQMPDMDGYELFRRVRERFPSVPMVLMTAYYYDKDHVIKRSKAEGLGDVIFKKPIDPARLWEIVGSRVGAPSRGPAA